MNNNEEQKRRHQQNTTRDGRDDFDRQIKNMLDDASLTPPPDFFERIESALKEEQENKKAALPEIDRKGIIISIKGFRRKWSYAASIGVLILLSIGFWKLNLFTGKDQPITSVLNPNTLLTPSDVQKGKQDVPKVAGDSSVGNLLSGNTPSGIDRKSSANKKTDIKSDRRNKLAEATPSIKSKETGRQSASITGSQLSKKEGTNADKITQKPDAGIKNNSNEKTETGSGTGHVAVGSQEVLNAGSNPIENKQPAAQTAATTVEQDKRVIAETIAKNKQRVTGQVKDPVADLEPGFTAESVPKEPAIDVKESRTLVDRAGNREEVQSESGRREKRGLFRGLVNHFKERVDEISNEMVDEDNNKTRIKVGCIAITTFK